MIKNLLSSLFVVAALAACGGGGGGGGGGAPTAAATVVSTLAFPLQQAIRNMNAYGNSATYESHGTLAAEATDGLCSGTLSSTNGAATATASAMFEGTPVYSSTDSSTVTYTNCTPSSSTSGGTNYYDGNYDQVGYVDSSSYRTYGAWTAPATVHVGDNGTLVSEMVYTNSSKSVVQYRRDISFTVAADTASTAIVNIIVRYYFPDYVDSFGTHAVYTLFSTVQSRNRITVGASLVELSTDTQRLTVTSTAGSSTQHHYRWNMVSNTPGTAPLAPSGTTTYAYTGAVQTVGVPVGATSVTVSAIGGGGGGTYTNGGAGGTVSASWNLVGLGSPSSLALYVGGAGATSSFINNGEGSSGAGGGGGATVVAFGISQALVIAGGGGGGGAGTDTTAAGGNGCGGNGGGSHGLSTLGGSGGGNAGTGGAGGAQSGVGGGSGGGSNGAVGASGAGGGGGGGGGSSTFVGGAGGTNNGVIASSGSGGFGGAAGNNVSMTNGGYGGGGAANYGAGGGGGYGGGGAGGYLGFPAYGGGGGGGSTYIRTAMSAAGCVPAAAGVGVGGVPHTDGQNGSVSITFN